MFEHRGSTLRHPFFYVKRVLVCLAQRRECWGVRVKLRKARVLGILSFGFFRLIVLAACTGAEPLVSLKSNSESALSFRVE